MAPSQRLPTRECERHAPRQARSPPKSEEGVRQSVRGSSHLVEGAHHAGLKGGNGLGRHFLSERCQGLGLFGEAFELLARLRNRQFYEFRGRWHGNEPTSDG